jgi:hypothetical protein
MKNSLSSIKGRDMTTGRLATAPYITDPEEHINHEAIDISYETLCQILQESAGDVEDSTAQLSESFIGLAQSANQQGDVLDTLIQTFSRLEYKGGYIRLEDFSQMMAGTISDTVDKIMTISENSISPCICDGGRVGATHSH